MPTPPTPKKRATRGKRKAQDWRPKFLESFKDTGTVRYACEAAGIHRSTAYDERRRNEDFAVAWAEAEDEATEGLEREAVRRAKDGSDTLLIFLLKARKPTMYRDNVKIEHTGAEGGPIQTTTKTDLSKLTPTELRDMRAMLERVSVAEPAEH